MDINEKILRKILYYLTIPVSRYQRIINFTTSVAYEKTDQYSIFSKVRKKLIFSKVSE